LESYDFTLELSRDIVDSEAEQIQSSCDDATIKYIPTGIDTGYTGTLVEFGRKAESLEQAIESAMRDIEVAPDLRATGITIPAPERDEPAAEETDSGEPKAIAEVTQADSDADPEPAKAAKKPSVKKTAARKPGTRKTGTRKAAADAESPGEQ
jgi:hypothetical protein